VSMLFTLLCRSVFQLRFIALFGFSIERVPLESRLLVCLAMAEHQ
jgi:hypothetical protein